MVRHNATIGFLLIGLVAPDVHSQRVPLLKDDVVPGAVWQETSPESVGYSSAKLEAMRGWLKTQDTGSMIVIAQGRIIFSYGDTAHISNIASVRKSVLGMLYGKYIFSDKIDVIKTVKQLGLDDKVPFLPIEENATLEQLMASRSGIYIPTDNQDQLKTLPPRGSEYPGFHYLYNNWDFNALGTAFEKGTGKKIFQALETDLAEPVGMQDYAISKQKMMDDPVSVHPGYIMSLSARDMARLGLLMLDYGSWNGKQVIPHDYVSYMTSLTTPFSEINPTGFRNYGEPARWGYGFLWWVWDAPRSPGQFIGFMEGAYTAMGTGGTFLTVLPSKRLVIVHQVDIDKKYNAYVSPTSYMAILSMIADANCFDSCN